MTQAILLSLAIALWLNLILFLIAFRLKSDKLTDISYALSFLAIDILALVRAPRRNAFSYILFALIAIWAFRIGFFLLLRVMKVGKDRRFDGIRENFIKFGNFWLGQAITSWLLMLPVVIAQHRTGKLNILVYIGIIIWLKGFLIEALADYQKFKFKQSKTKAHEWISSGIWNYSRHPNYYGEIATWVGVYVFCFSPLDLFLRIVCLSSPILITLLLVFVSGIPLLEKSADARWGDQKDYQSYKARTSILVPWFHSK